MVSRVASSTTARSVSSVRSGVRVGDGHLRLRPDRGHRRAQFVGGVAGEPLEPGHGIVPPGEQGVELLGERPQLVLGHRHRQALPRRQGGGGRAHPVDGTQRGPGRRPPRERHHGGHDEGADEEPDRGVRQQDRAAHEVGGHDDQPG